MNKTVIIEKIIMKKIEGPDELKKIISIVLLICWCLLIFYFSEQNGGISGLSSSKVIDLINKILKINLYNFKYSVFIVRKIAHMFLYFVLYILSLNCFKNLNIKKYNLISIIFCLIYSISDEVHQLFVIGRTFKVLDILIDMFGAMIGYCFRKLINKLSFK